MPVLPSPFWEKIKTSCGGGRLFIAFCRNRHYSDILIINYNVELLNFITMEAVLSIGFIFTLVLMIAAMFLIYCRPRDKRIKKLEEENARLRQKLSEQENAGEKFHRDNGDFL